MAALLKVFMGLLVIVCLAELIEMAPAPEDKSEDAGAKMLKDLTDQLNNALNNEDFKKFLDGASNVFSDGLKSFESQMNDWRGKIDELAEKKN